MEGEPGMARPAMTKPGIARLGLAIMPAMAQPMPGMARLGHRWCLRLMGRMVSPSPPNPDRHLYRGVGADKRRKERRELQRQGKEVPPELQPLKISLNKALKRQMHELHTKAREMAQEEDPEKLKKWEEEQSIWLEIVAREEAEKKAASSTKSEDDSKEGDGPKPEEGSRNMPDDGTGDKAPDNMDIGNRARSRSLSSGRFYSSRARPEMGRGVRLAHGLPIPEMEEEEEAEDNKPEEGSRKKKKKGGPKATSQRWLQSKKNQTLMGPLALMGEEVQLQLQ